MARQARASAPKVFVTNQYTNRISHRALTPRERAERMFIGDKAHDTWDAAHAHLVAQCTADVAKAASELKRRQNKLKRAQAMKPPATKDKP